MANWTIKSAGDKLYRVHLDACTQAHARSVLADLVDCKWVPDDLKLRRRWLPRRR